MAVLAAAIRMWQVRIIASDVTAEVSSYRYRSRFTRFLSGLDRQTEIPERTLSEWQVQHQQVNRHLLSLLVP